MTTLREKRAKMATYGGGDIIDGMEMMTSILVLKTAVYLAMELLMTILVIVKMVIMRTLICWLVVIEHYEDDTCYG